MDTKQLKQEFKEFIKTNTNNTYVNIRCIHSIYESEGGVNAVIGSGWLMGIELKLISEFVENNANCFRVELINNNLQLRIF